MQIVDTSSNTTNHVTCMASKGVQIIFRYYSTTPNWKVITPTEARAISAAGIKLGIVFEDGTSIEEFSKESGYNNAVSAYKYATETINQPFGSAIYFAVDFDVTEAQIQSNIIPYFIGIQNGLAASNNGMPGYHVGAYGCGAVVNALLNQGLCQYRWLSESGSFNGTQAALNNGNYELEQRYANDFKICTVAVDQDFLHPDVIDVGAFTLD